MPIQWSQLADTEAAGYTIQQAPETPPEWLDMEKQVLAKQILREFVPA